MNLLLDDFVTALKKPSLVLLLVETTFEGWLDMVTGVAPEGFPNGPLCFSACSTGMLENGHSLSEPRL